MKKAEIRVAEDNTLIPHVKMGVEASKSHFGRFEHGKSVVPSSFAALCATPGSRTSADKEWPRRCPSDLASTSFEEVRRGTLNCWANVISHSVGVLKSVLKASVLCEARPLPDTLISSLSERVSFTT